MAEWFAKFRLIFPLFSRVKWTKETEIRLKEVILLRYINSILQYHLHGSRLKQVRLTHSSRATFYSGHSVTLPAEALEMRNTFYPLPWLRRNGTPKQLCEIMRYLLTETCVTLLIDFSKCAKNCDKIDLILNCIFTIFFYYYQCIQFHIIRKISTRTGYEVPEGG